MFWHQQRLRRVTVAIYCALILSIPLTALLDIDGSSSVLRGDFPAFYTAGAIVLGEQANALYSPELQNQTQTQLWPAPDQRYLYFAYPPAVALLFAPLAALPPLASKALFSLLMLCCLALSVAIIRKHAVQRDDSLQAGFMLFLFFSFGPIYSSLVAGQNSALIILLFTLFVTALSSRHSQSDLRAGLALGCLLFKPQFAIVPYCYAALKGRWRLIAYSLLPAAALYLIGALLLGFSWPVTWIEAATEFAATDFENNKHQMISLLGLSSSLGPLLGLSALDATRIGYAMIAIISLLAAAQFFRTREIKINELALLGPLAILCSPHTLYYDAGLLVLSGLLVFSVERDRRLSYLFALYSLVFLVSSIKGLLVFQPLSLLVMCFAFYLIWNGRSRGNEGQRELPTNLMLL